MNEIEKLGLIRKLADDTMILRQSLTEELGKKIVDLALLMSGVIGSGGKIVVAANGGQIGTASNFVSELLVRVASTRKRPPLPALTLTSDTSVMTAAADEFGYENLFARQIEGLGNKGDLFLVLSTDGNDINLIRAVQAAREKGLINAALLGGKGGDLVKIVERSIVVPHPSAHRVQEEHLFISHTIVDLLERDLLG
jgi:D-sedoheptulose 7-phosphate isomerase